MLRWFIIHGIAAALALGAAAEETTYRRSTSKVTIPEVDVTDQSGRKLPATGVFAAKDKPLFVQFIFTTCPTICPAQAATFAGAQKELGDAARFVSVTIDPEHDTPARLAAFAKQFDAGEGWSLVTGKLADIASIQRAFGVYQGNKMWHAPLTFMRPAGAAPEWIRLDGLVTAQQLASEGRSDARRSRSTIEAGRRLYEEGRTRSGNPVRALIAGGTKVEGKQFACAGCHRPSGFGSKEGRVKSPPVTANALFRPLDRDRGDQFRELFQERDENIERVRDMKPRPAYDRETLGRALRSGVDPAGRPLDAIMPRYDLADEDLVALHEYLQSLGASPDPGVDPEKIRFAVVIDEGVAADRREAVLAVMRAYVRRKNSDSRAKLMRGSFSPLYKDELVRSFRLWEVDEWLLKGDTSTWKRQLEAKLAQQPVFAIVGGISDRPWASAHRFCEQNDVPCFFPITHLPELDAQGGQTLYFSEGYALEGAALGAYLNELRKGDSKLRVLQIRRDSDETRALSEGLRSRFEGKIDDVILTAGKGLSDELTKAPPGDAALVLWLGADDLAAFDHDGAAYASGTLADGFSVKGTGDLRLTWPGALPGTEPVQIHRVRAWLRSRKVRTTDEREQLLTWFAWAIVDHALVHLVENYSRDYLVEVIEHETENRLNPGAFQRLSLGPGQRFASKGCWILDPQNGAVENGAPSGKWLTP